MEKTGEITDKTPDDQKKSDEKRAGADSKDHASDRAAEAAAKKK